MHTLSMETLPMRRFVVLPMFVAAALMFETVGGAAQAPAAAPAAPLSTPAAAPVPAWVKRSNEYTQMLLDVQLKHSPEGGSRQGIVKYDPLITDATRADEIVERNELVDLLAKVNKAGEKEKDKNVREDLEIIRKTFNLQFREDDYQLAHKVPFIDASEVIFGGLRTLLDDQVAPERRPAAVIRLRKYAGVEPGFVGGRDGDGAWAGQELRRWHSEAVSEVQADGLGGCVREAAGGVGGLRYVDSRQCDAEGTD
jgi:hypothetical protein